MQEEKVLLVRDFLKLVNETLRLIPRDAFVVEGEVSDFRVSQGKWATFDLKDEEVDVKVPCFASVFRIGHALQNGMRVRVRGDARVFERFGKFSLNVDDVLPVGEGALQKAYRALKKKLEDEGVFSPERKRALPQFPERIGLITSADAAAYGDFLRVLQNRFGGLTVIHQNVHVQGQYAVDEIVEAFALMQRLPDAQYPDVLVLTRGGGSLEDLHAFNDERVVRAVASSRIPVVVGVGHERDESLCDFAADVRASTPSNAAERIAPSRVELLRVVRTSEDRMKYVMDESVRRLLSAVNRSLTVFDHAITRTSHGINDTVMRFRVAFDRFRLSVVATREHIERRERGAGVSFQNVFEKTNARVESLLRLMKSVDPERVLARGYSIIRKEGVIVRSAGVLAPGDKFSVQFGEGAVDAEVLKKIRQEKLL